MNAGERAETREMMHDVLSGWQAGIVAQNDITNMALVEIKDHLKELNGKVAKHEMTINKNLPHSVANCTQTENIELLKKAILARENLEAGEERANERQSLADALNATNRRDKRYIVFSVIALCLTLAGLIWGIYNMKETRKEVERARQDISTSNEIITRGQQYIPSLFRTDTTENE